MICLRCGYCCIDYFVPIINPKYIDNVDLVNLIQELDNKIEDLIILKEDGKECPYLEKQKDNQYICKIHDLKVYQSTPCFQHSQIEQSGNSVCRIGNYRFNNSTR